MAAGEGFKTWQTGDVLTANDVNGYLMQGVWVFDDAADRTAQVTSPAEGNFSYLRDTNKLYYYTGSAWAEADTSGILPSEFTAKGDLLVGTGSGTFDNLPVGTNGHVLTVDSGETTGVKWAAPGTGAMVLIASATPSAASTVNFNNVFTSAYRNYKITWEGVGSTAAALNFRFRVSASDDSTSNYTFQRLIYGASTVSTSRSSTSTAGEFGTARTILTSGEMTVFRPQLSSLTLLYSTFLDNESSGTTPEGRIYHNMFNATTQFDGISFYPASGNITGNFYIYGLAN